MEDAVSVVWRWSRDTQFPFIKILLFKYCFDMYTCLYSTCYITLVSYTQNVAYIYILQVIDDIEVFHMEWNDNSWREATWRFFAIYSIILNSTHEYLIKKGIAIRIYSNIRFIRLTWRVIALSNRLLCVVHVRGIYCLINAQVLARLFTLVTRFHVIMNTFAAIDI